MDDSIPIEELLGRLGLRGADLARGRATLEAAGLTNPRKSRISVAKLERAGAAIDAAWARLCARCAETHDGDRPVLAVDPALCAACHGSGTRRALDELARRLPAAGVRRVVVVGGSPSFRQELERLGSAVELRLVDGTARRTGAEAGRDVDWADLVVVLGGTELAHKVSLLYTRDPSSRAKRVVTARRGVEAVAAEILRHLEGGR
ncbi:MAG: hypothetical protein R3C15_18640 [Thermoleophilia bacterium]